MHQVPAEKSYSHLLTTGGSGEQGIRHCVPTTFNDFHFLKGDKNRQRYLHLHTCALIHTLEPESPPPWTSAEV